MTTVVAVRKHGEVVIAADSLVTFGDTRLGPRYEANRKIIQVGGTYLGLAGSTAHFVVLERALTELGEDCKLGSRDEVFSTFQKIHPILKEKFYLNPKEDEDDPYESSQITCLLANASGIYGVYSYREVFAFDRFWGIGSGRSFALGAMYALWDGPATATQIARAGVEAGIEFDKSSDRPVQIVTLALTGGEQQ